MDVIESNVSNTLFSPKNKGARLKRVRNLANLARSDIETKYGISIDTLKGWEVGRHGGLTNKGANKIINLLSKEGVAVSVEWLLYGAGAEPKLIPSLGAEKQSEDQIIQTELKLFYANHENAIDFLVMDDSMTPYFNFSDLVAGVKCAKLEFNNLIGQDCIIELLNGNKLLRRVSSIHDQLLTIMCVNPNTQAQFPILQEIDVMSAAKVIWLRRRT